MSGEPLNTEEARYQALKTLDVAAEGALEALVAGLHDESWRVRRAATEGVVEVPERERAVTRLIAVLGERGEAGARNGAAEALAAMGEVAVGPLIGLLAHPDPDQRKFAADILGQAGRPEAEGALVAALEDPDLNVRVSAAEALGRAGDEVGARALERCLCSPEPLLQLSVLESLVVMRRPLPLQEVMPFLNDPRLQRSALRMLGLIPHPEATAHVCRGLDSSVRSIREGALGALGSQMGLAEPSRRAELEAVVQGAIERMPGASDWVGRALEAEELAVRAGALIVAAALREPQLAGAVARVAQEDRLLPEVLRTLSRFGPEAGRVLLESLEYLSLPAREAAGQALVGLVDETYVPELIEMLEWGEKDLRGVAVQALGRTRSQAAVAPLVRLLDIEELAGLAARALVGLAESFPEAVFQALEEALARGTTPAAVEAIAQVGGKEALPVLRRTARQAHPWLRAAAVEMAAGVERSVGLELARVALTDEAAPVRAAAVRVVGRSGDESARRLLERALRDEDVSVQLAAVDAVGEGGAREYARELEALMQRPEGGIALRAVRALARLGALEGEVLRRAVAHEDPEVVKTALVTGAASAERSALAVALLGHSCWDVRVCAARVLGDSGGREGLPALRNALSAETDTLARRSLAETIERLERR